jgi:hypothetical protein
MARECKVFRFVAPGRAIHLTHVAPAVSAAPTRKLLESLRHAVLLFVSQVPDEILIEHEKKDSKMRPGKMKMRWIGVVEDDGNVIGRYISISNTSTGEFPRVPATQIWQHDPRTNTVHWQEAPTPFAKKAVRMWLEQKGVRAERHVPIGGQM